MRYLIAFALLASAAPLGAQTATVSPGMSHAQVVVALGVPATTRTAHEYTYLFYVNQCGRECGMNDLVVLHRDSVVDAIFRSPERQYTGVSSSPTEVAPGRAVKRVASRPKPAPAPAESPAERPATTAAPIPDAPLRMAPGRPNDTRPSIPVNSPEVTAAAPAPAAPNKAVEVPGTKREAATAEIKPEVKPEVQAAAIKVVIPPVNPEPDPAAPPMPAPVIEPTPSS